MEEIQRRITEEEKDMKLTLTGGWWYSTSESTNSNVPIPRVGDKVKQAFGDNRDLYVVKDVVWEYPMGDEVTVNVLLRTLHWWEK